MAGWCCDIELDCTPRLGARKCGLLYWLVVHVLVSTTTRVRRTATASGNMSHSLSLRSLNWELRTHIFSSVLTTWLYRNPTYYLLAYAWLKLETVQQVVPFLRQFLSKAVSTQPICLTIWNLIGVKYWRSMKRNLWVKLFAQPGRKSPKKIRNHETNYLCRRRLSHKAIQMLHAIVRVATVFY